MLVIVPKDSIIPPPQTPRWITYVSVTFKTGLEEFSPRYFVTMVLAFAVSILANFLFGRDLAQVAAEYRIGGG